MSSTETSHDDVVVPALLRAARGAYAASVRLELAADGFEDLPRNGAFVIGGMANHGATPSDLVRQLRISKQATSQLIDSLVLRGYLERETDPSDRRRLTLALTERGVAAAAAVRRGVVAVDTNLERAITAEQLAGMRAGLIALCDIAEMFEELASSGVR
ncbi:MAG TPA: MarR family transcriptional regulator [Gaiellaceae bacterium]|nr:MarR family transcriptional regulator [Gaiellaceae bacterium]